MPTSEDLREYQFPQLVSSTNKQRAAAGDFIDSLNLAEEGQEEKIDPKMTFNPAIQYFGQVVCDKIKNVGQKTKTDKLPELNKAVQEYIKPDREMY